MTIGRRDAAALGGLALLPVFLLAPVLFGSRMLFVNDLIHLSHPWRVLDAELLEKGRLPLWDPYTFCGLPFIGNLQAGVFGSFAPVFHVFSFSRALAPVLLLIFWLGTLFSYLWLRSRGARPAAAAGGSLLFAAGGAMVSQMQFPHVMETLAWSPAFMLLAAQPATLALASAEAFLAGYPPAWVGCVGATLLLRTLFGGTVKEAARSAAAAVAGLLIAALVVVPGMELAGRSGRTQGRSAPPALRMAQSADLPDLLSVIHPELTRLVESRGAPPEVNRVVWTYDHETTTFTFVVPAGREHVADPGGLRYSHLASAYLGVAGAAAALLGLAALIWARPAAGLGAAAFVGAVLVASLGANQPAAAWLWTHAPYLKQLRGPSRLMYFILMIAPTLAAAGLQAVARRTRPWAWLWIAAIGLELGATGWGYHPLETRDFFAERGPLVQLLRERLDGMRYFLVPEGEIWPQLRRSSPDPRFERFRDVMYRTYKQKLYGLANLPFHLESASGSYEPLIPSGVDAAIQGVREAVASRALAGMLAWLGCRYVLVKDELAPQLVGHPQALLPGRLLDRGMVLWRVYETPEGPARARWLAEKDAAVLDRTLETTGPPVGTPWSYRRPREDRFEAQGDAPGRGRLFLPEPFYPGWRVYVDGTEKTIEPALGGFSQVRVEGGKTRAVFVYRPWTWLAGLWTTLLALGALAVWAMRLRGPIDFTRISSA